MNAKPRTDATATLVHRGLLSGFSDPEADLAVDQLAEAVASMSGLLRGALIGAYGDRVGPQMLAFFLTDLGRNREQVWRVLDQARVKPLAVRTVAYHELVLKAMRALLANPLSVEGVTSDRIFPELIADILRYENEGGRPVVDMVPVLAGRYVTGPAIDADRALAILRRARRDRRRYDDAVASKHKVTPLIVPGNLTDRDDYRTSHRSRYVREVSWAIPSEEALRAISALGPIVEIGAGGGYWAQLLRERGVDILAFDQQPDPELNPKYLARTWGPVAQAPATIAAEYPERTLLLIWPPQDDPMAHQALQNYRGDRVAYIGGSYQGLWADDAFHQLLAEEWEYTDRVDLPTWEYLEDRVHIYRCR
jgi:hypothetical protein